MNTNYLNTSKELLSRVVWTHKIQECLYERISKKEKTYKIIKCIFYALSASGVVVSAVADSKWATISSSIVLFFVTLIDSLIKAFSYEGKVSKIKVDTSSLLRLRDDLILSIKKYENGLYTDKEFMVIIEQSTRSYDNLCATLEKSSNKDVEHADYKLKERKDEKPNLDIVEEMLNK